MPDTKRQFDSDLGSVAKVSRSEEQGEREKVLNLMLREMGREANQLPDTSEYLGSFATHVYKPKGQVSYLHYQHQVAPMQFVPEEVADKAMTDLKGTLMEFYGRNRPTKRSGF